ncbi:MAG: NADH-quinone oxidoreductase subunit J [Gemmatimonadota bacterium]|nr:NADH-quinone oxidoreductase subunit J [Gemmatimonadota bacterium]
MVQILFYVFGAIAIGCGVGVVVARNPVASLLAMVASLASVAGIFVLLEAHFLAAIQVLVYAGAIMVLFLFVIMLLNLGHEARSDLRTGAWMIAGFALCGGVVGAVLTALGRSDMDGTTGPAAQMLDAMVLEKGAVGVIADPLFTTYVVPFELTGILLLIAVVGAIALAKRRV